MYLKITKSHDNVRFELRKNRRYGRSKVISEKEAQELLKDAILVSETSMKDFSVKLYELK